MQKRYWLSDSFEKLERASELLRSAHDEVEAFKRDRPFKFRVEQDPNPPKAGANLIRVHCDYSPGVEHRLRRFGVLAGEVVHHLRTSLNHLVWHLITRNGNVPTSASEFPLFLEQHKYDRVQRTKLAGVPENFWHQFRAVQPFNREGEDDPLWIVHTLDVRDKHHVLLIALGVLPVEHEDKSDLQFYRLQDGELVGRIWTPDPVGAEPEYPFSVALEQGGGRPIIFPADLFLYMDAVEDVLREFNELF